MTAASLPSPLLLVVSTLGRLPSLATLLDSVVPQLGESDELVIVAQGEFDAVHDLVRSHASRTAGTLTSTTSERGLSRGRNTGVRDRRGSAPDPLVMFPNDTSWFAEGSVDAIRRTASVHDLAAVPVLVEGDPRFVLPHPGTPLDTRNVWSVIEMGLVIRLSLLQTVGGFDETIGTGADSPWQAGEGTDLILRVLNQNPAIANGIVWATDPLAYVGGVGERSGLSRAEQRWKLRAYGRGVGRVYRAHPFPMWQRLGFVAAGLLIGIRRRGEYGLTDGVPAFMGRLEGLLGRTFGRRSDARAVSR
ncbi:glycosyltransferase family 2 protein [Microbacterium sp.]|uniref:glycosyltransferase family 2 protein n=1 Tax=Microbacterium sp. TaxID=51671 RepID=UPI00260E98E0|nr:glycosyltransferase family A protein [Microbacterium sp.]